MARHSKADEAGDPFAELNPYFDLIWYEYALRREAGLEPQEPSGSRPGESCPPSGFIQFWQ